MIKMSKLIIILLYFSISAIQAGPTLSKAKLNAELTLGLVKVVEDGEYSTQYTLDLSGRDLPELNFNNFPVVQLRFRSSVLQRYTENDVCHLHLTTNLNLSNNQLRSLPTGIGSFRENLTSLNLSKNNLRTLPREIGDLANLIDLKINSKHSEKQKLQALPPEFGNLRNLIILDLAGNELQELPEEFSNLTRLKDLNLSSNKFQSFPIQVTKLKKLKKLALSHNEIEQLPEEIGELTELDWLELPWNKLQSIPAQIEGCSKLRGLILSGNKLKSIPAETGMMRKLKCLGIDFNEIHSLPTEVVNRFGEELINDQLTIRFNKLQALPPNSIVSSNANQELQRHFEQLRRFIFKAIKDNHLPDVRGFIHLHAEPWQLHLKDFKDENSNNLLHLAVMHNAIQQEGHSAQTLDPKWCILKELIACNVNDSAAKMLKEENADGKTPLNLLIPFDGNAFFKICQKLCYFSEQLPDTIQTTIMPTFNTTAIQEDDNLRAVNSVSTAVNMRYGQEVSPGKYEDE
jgi:Leucine-rich repeat (LRR) protein